MSYLPLADEEAVFLQPGFCLYHLIRQESSNVEEENMGVQSAAAPRVTLG